MDIILYAYAAAAVHDVRTRCGRYRGGRERKSVNKRERASEMARGGGSNQRVAPAFSSTHLWLFEFSMFIAVRDHVRGEL